MFIKTKAVPHTKARRHKENQMLKILSLDSRVQNKVGQQNFDFILINLEYCYTREGGYPLAFALKTKMVSRLRGNDENRITILIIIE